jgi:hypothetical protein
MGFLDWSLGARRTIGWESFFLQRIVRSGAVAEPWLSCWGEGWIGSWRDRDEGFALERWQEKLVQ